MTVTVGPYKNGKATYEVKVSQATAESGMYRTILQEKAYEDVADENTANPIEMDKPIDMRVMARRILHTVIYPAMIAASEPVNGFKEWPISFDEYAKLPEPFIIEWENAVFEANPHWTPKKPETKAETDEQEKKVPDSSQKS